MLYFTLCDISNCFNKIHCMGKWKVWAWPYPLLHGWCPPCVGRLPGYVHGNFSFIFFLKYWYGALSKKWNWVLLYYYRKFAIKRFFLVEFGVERWVAAILSCWQAVLLASKYISIQIIQKLFNRFFLTWLVFNLHSLLFPLVQSYRIIIQ